MKVGVFYVSLAVAMSTALTLRASQVRDLEQHEVGANVIAAIPGSPLRFLDALLAEGIPAGLHIRSGKWEALRGEGPADEAQGVQKTTVAQAAALFVASHPGWSVDVMATGVVIRDVGVTPREDRIPEFSVLNMEIRAAFNAAERAIDPAIPLAGGMVDSVISDPDAPSPLRPAPVLVTVHLIQASLEQVLNSIAAESVGTGWVLVRGESDGRKYDRLSVRYPGRRHSESAWPLAVPRR